MTNPKTYLPNGTYEAKLVWISERMIEIKGEEKKVYFTYWKVVAGEHKGETFWTSFWPWDCKAGFPTRKMGKAMGMERVGKRFNLVGNICLVTIERTKPPFHKGVRYEPIPDNPL